MVTMIAADFYAAVRASLDGDATDWPDGIIDAAVAKAASDLERLGLPKESITDLTLSFTITDEDFTSSLDVAVSLDNSCIDYGSESVKTEDGVTTYVRDTDYTMDYANGTITVLTTGSMEDATGYHISYLKDKRIVSLSSLGAFINIDSVEYPTGQTPIKKCTWDIFGTNLMIMNQEGDEQSQQELTEGYHVIIRYTSKHTLPQVAAGGTWDEYMDYVMVQGTSAYAMLYRALAYMQYGREALESNTTLWTDFDSRLAEALAYLSTGDDYIPTVNVGVNVPEIYAAYAEQLMSMVNQLRQRAEIYAQTGVAAYQMATALIASGERRLGTFSADVLSRVHARGNKFQASAQQIPY